MHKERKFALLDYRLNLTNLNQEVMQGGRPRGLTHTKQEVRSLSFLCREVANLWLRMISSLYQSAESSLSIIYQATCNYHKRTNQGQSFQSNISSKPSLFGVPVRAQPFPGIVHFYWDLQVCALRGEDRGKDGVGTKTEAEDRSRGKKLKDREDRGHKERAEEKIKKRQWNRNKRRGIGGRGNPQQTLVQIHPKTPANSTSLTDPN